MQQFDRPLNRHLNQSALSKFGRTVLAIFSISMLLVAANAFAQQPQNLQLPEDIAARQAEADAKELKFQIQESRIGGRLERVTIKRNNGIDEVYENKNVDSMWLSEEKQLGDIPNVRRWTIGSW